MGGTLCNGEVIMWLAIFLEGKLWLSVTKFRLIKFIFHISLHLLQVYSCTFKWYLGREVDWMVLYAMVRSICKFYDISHLGAH